MPFNIFQILAIFWFIRTVKVILFYLYLWQLKEYHIGRFLDHFRTEKGEQLILNKLNFLKTVLFIYFFSLPILFHYSDYFRFPSTAALSLNYLFPVSLLVIYFFEDLKVLLTFLKKRLKFPVLTKKIVLLLFLAVTLAAGIIFTIFYYEGDLNYFTLWLLLFDFLSILFVSAIVLIFQPFAVILRGWTMEAARKKRESFKNLLVIGVTGSYGKTSTKEFLYSVLSKKFNVLKTKENQNSEIGISQCILRDLKPEHKIFIAEMGAYGKGRIKLLSRIAKPKIGVLTGINEQHLALFGSQENIIKTKYELIEALPENGLAIFNGDNKYCLELYQKTKKPRKLLSSHSQALDVSPDIWAENILVQKDYVFFKACTKDGCENFKAYLSGGHFVPNLLTSILVAKELGMEMKEISEAILKIESPKKTMKMFRGIKNLMIIDDSYSANPIGVIAALDYLKIYGGKKIIILPSLIELGKEARRIHYQIGEKIGEVCDAVIITSKDYFNEISQGFLSKDRKKESIFFTDNPTKILEIIQNSFSPGDVVLLEGRVPEKLISSLIKS